MNAITVERMATTRLPTDEGDFVLHLYHNSLDDKEHLALVSGAVDGQQDVLTRVHSECLTGDVLGSLRCDCGPQLEAAVSMIAAEGLGVILYLRQEGRGIGLLEKLRAYNLQDEGYDTVDANLMLGHQPDLRDYRVAAAILKDLGIRSVRLLTNNPDKINGLGREGIEVAERIPLQAPITNQNAFYLDTKARRMRHLLDLDQATSNGQVNDEPLSMRSLDDLLRVDQLRLVQSRVNRPQVTLSYAQSLDGSIALQRGQSTAISGPESMRLTHMLRAWHDAILVGIGTVMADDPQLTVRLLAGSNPQPIVLDSELRFPVDSRLLQNGRRPWIATTEVADPQRQAELEALGGRVIRLPADGSGLVSLEALLTYLGAQGVRRVMVEGGATVISKFLATHMADKLVLTIAPLVLGGLNAADQLGRMNGHGTPRLANRTVRSVGSDMVVFGDLYWE